MPSEHERESTAPIKKDGKPLVQRFVLLATSSPVKVAEYAALLDKFYAVQVRQASPSLVEDSAARAAALEVPGCLAVLYDQAALVDGGGVPVDTGLAGVAEARVTLTAWLRDQEGGAAAPPAFSITDVTRGFIDPSLAVPPLHKAAGIASVFGYDDIFAPLATGVTYHAASQGGHGKVSSRLAVASALARQMLHFKAHVDLKHAPLHQHASIDFALDVTDFVEGHPLLSRGLAVPGYGALLRSVLNGGIFLKSPGNKRERNYWWPGLNAGLPLTPKDDAIHEATYAAHDFGHFKVPDLLFTGSPLCTSRLGRRVYLIHRMLSEAVTMVLADMLYAEGLRRQGVAYDWAKRKIWPLLAAAEAHTGRSLLGGAALDTALLHDLIAANAAFALCGDAGPYAALVGPEGAGALAAYKGKYAPFFVADYAWTAANVGNMARRAPSFAAWWAQAEQLRALDGEVAASTPSVDEWLGHLQGAAPGELLAAAAGEAPLTPPQLLALVGSCLQLIWERALAPTLASPPPAAPRPLRLFRAFLRYSMGQHAAFVDHEGSRLAAPVRAALVGALRRAAGAGASGGGALTLPEVAGLRALYSEFIASLAQRELAISADDAVVFAEVYPLFEPTYVAYLLPGSSTDQELADAAVRATNA